VRDYHRNKVLDERDLVDAISYLAKGDVKMAETMIFRALPDNSFRHEILRVIHEA